MRREFTRSIKVSIIKRATKNGVVYCEGCGSLAKRFDIDHTIPDGMMIDKSRKLTADDGQLLCSGGKDTCHGKKTPDDVAAIAKSKRIEAKSIGIKNVVRRPIQSPGFVKAEPTKTDKISIPPRRSLYRSI